MLKTDPEWRAPDGHRVNLQLEMGSPVKVGSTFAAPTADTAGAYKATWNACWGRRFARVLDGDVVSLCAEL